MPEVKQTKLHLEASSLGAFFYLFFWKFWLLKDSDFLLHKRHFALLFGYFLALKRWNLTKNPGLNLSPCRAFVLKEYIRAYKLTALDKLFKPSLYFSWYRAKPFSCKVFFMASFRKGVKYAAWMEAFTSGLTSLLLSGNICQMVFRKIVTWKILFLFSETKHILSKINLSLVENICFTLKFVCPWFILSPSVSPGGHNYLNSLFFLRFGQEGALHRSAPLLLRCP